MQPTRANARRVIKLVFGVIQIALLGRVVLLLFAPSVENTAATTYLDLTQPLVDPFGHAVRAAFTDPSGSIVDTYALAALVGYTLLELVLIWLTQWRSTRREPIPPLPVELLGHHPNPTSTASEGDPRPGAS